jgi:hypothetical protein
LILNRQAEPFPISCGPVPMQLSVCSNVTSNYASTTTLLVEMMMKRKSKKQHMYLLVEN